MKNNLFIYLVATVLLCMWSYSPPKDTERIYNVDNQVEDYVPSHHSISNASHNKIAVGERVVINFCVRAAETTHIKTAKFQNRIPVFCKCSCKENSSIKSHTQKCLLCTNLLSSQNHIKIQRFNI